MSSNGGVTSFSQCENPGAACSRQVSPVAPCHVIGEQENEGGCVEKWGGALSKFGSGCLFSYASTAQWKCAVEVNVGLSCPWRCAVESYIPRRSMEVLYTYSSETLDHSTCSSETYGGPLYLFNAVLWLFQDLLVLNAALEH